MAHFAELDIDNNVLRVLKACDTDIANNGGEWSDEAAAHFETVVPFSATGIKWVQTSKHTKANVHELGGTPMRKNYAGVGGKYDPSADGFYAAQPYASWTLNPTTFIWDPPTPEPVDETKSISWKEDTQQWVGVNTEEETDGENAGKLASFIWNPDTNSWDADGFIEVENDPSLSS
tara:strand:- start:210 stop:737 length:528 start_codon:yes stop_codon:yes gene_type:complete